MTIVLKTLFDWFNSVLKYAGPVLIVFFTLAILAGILKWSNRTKVWIKEVSKNPILIILWIAVSLLIIFLFYKYAMPLINGGSNE